MAANAKPVTQIDFSGGMNAVVNPYLISQKQTADLQNLVLDEHGSVRTRDGSAILTTSPDLVNPIYLRGQLLRNTGQAFPFAVQASPGAAVALDTTAGATAVGGLSTKSFNMTLGGTATLLLISVHLDVEATVNSVTYNGVAARRIGSATATSPPLNDAKTELWGLLSPTTGSSLPLVVTLAAVTPLGWRIQGHSYTNATGWGAPQTASGSTAGTVSLTVPSATNSRVVGILSASSVTTPTPNGTSLYNELFSDDDRAQGQQLAGAASVTVQWTNVAANEWAAVAVDIFSGVNNLWSTHTTPWTDAGDLNPDALPDVVYMSDEAVFLHGYAIPKSWDGTTLANITAQVGQTVPPGAKHGVFHLGALWVWNTSAVTSSLDGPSSLRACSTNNNDDWPNANQIFISKDDGQVGMGIVPFTIVETGIAPTSTLVAFKNYRGYQVTGVFGSSNFGVQPIKSDMGCVAPRTIQFVSGFGVIRFTHKGFALYNGVEDRLISEEIRPAIFGGRGFTGLDFSTIQGSWAQQSQNPPLYIAACPLSGVGLSRLFVYDLIRRGWSICTLPFDISCMNLIFSPTQFPVIHMGDTVGGNIHDFFSGRTQDGDEDIPWSMKTRSFFSANPMTPSFWRRAQLTLAGEPNRNITVTPIIEGQERDAQIWTFPDSNETEVETVFSPDILETNRTVQLLIEGSGPVRIRGLEFQVSPKPSTKYTNRG